jgi:hypothetical protein
MEARAHELDVTESRYRRDTAHVKVHLHGRLFEVDYIHAGADYEEDKGDRKSARRFRPSLPVPVSG